MSTLIASIQAQITALDAKLVAINPTSVASNGTSITNPDWIALSKHRIFLEQQLDRLSGNAPMMVRGRIKGL
jgi:hypothetical protein